MSDEDALVELAMDYFDNLQFDVVLFILESILEYSKSVPFLAHCMMRDMQYRHLYISPGIDRKLQTFSWTNFTVNYINRNIRHLLRSNPTARQLRYISYAFCWRSPCCSTVRRRKFLLQASRLGDWHAPLLLAKIGEIGDYTVEEIARDPMLHLYTRYLYRFTLKELKQTRTTSKLKTYGQLYSLLRNKTFDISLHYARLGVYDTLRNMYHNRPNDYHDTLKLCQTYTDRWNLQRDNLDLFIISDVSFNLVDIYWRIADVYEALLDTCMFIIPITHHWQIIKDVFLEAMYIECQIGMEIARVRKSMPPIDEKLQLVAQYLVKHTVPQKKRKRH